jgi:hypothetical protein
MGCLRFASWMLVAPMLAAQSAAPSKSRCEAAHCQVSRAVDGVLWARHAPAGRRPLYTFLRAVWSLELR